MDAVPNSPLDRSGTNRARSTNPATNSLGVSGRHVYMVGIKGTGMAALAEIFAAQGDVVTGSDTTETFYTDTLLRRAAIPYAEGFSARNLPAQVDLVVYSAAYDRATHPELVEARRRGLPIVTYTEALGAISRYRPAVAVAGVHGKTTTTALLGTLLKAVGSDATVLVGSAVSTFDGKAVYVGGGTEGALFVAETCEYRRHFLDFYPDLVLVTNIEADHLDYFRDEADVADAFFAFASRLPDGGTLVYCADDDGACAVADRVAEERPDVRRRAYGERAKGDFAVCVVSDAPPRFTMPILGGEVTLRVPGRHNTLNAAAAVAAYHGALELTGASPPGAPIIVHALEAFAGTTRRAEVVGEARGVLFMDDYGHHPTAVAMTLAGLKAYYPGRRLVVDFMSHTFTRTARLLHDFGRCFSSADLVFVNKIYASAREGSERTIDGGQLAEEIAKHHPAVTYVAELEEAEAVIKATLQDGDLFVTMGAGDNWRIAHRLFRDFSES